MRGLDHRVVALEKRTDSHCNHVIFVLFVGAAGPINDEPIGYMSDTGGAEQRWMREDGETIEQTLKRAKREAPRAGPRCVVLLHEITDGTEM